MTIGYTPYAETLVVLGAVFIISSAVGIYMMLATRQVARKPHERFNEQNIILHKIDGNVEKQIIILEKMNSSLVDIASSQKQNHSEMITILKKIGNWKK